MQNKEGGPLNTKATKYNVQSQRQEDGLERPQILFLKSMRARKPLLHRNIFKGSNDLLKNLMTLCIIMK